MYTVVLIKLLDLHNICITQSHRLNRTCTVRIIHVLCVYVYTMSSTLYMEYSTHSIVYSIMWLTVIVCDVYDSIIIGKLDGRSINWCGQSHDEVLSVFNSLVVQNINTDIKWSLSVGSESKSHLSTHIVSAASCTIISWGRINIFTVICYEKKLK